LLFELLISAKSKHLGVFHLKLDQEQKEVASMGLEAGSSASIGAGRLIVF